MLIRLFLLDTVFKPTRQYFNASTATAAMAAFLASALLHVIVTYYTFGTGLFPTFGFFMLHGVAVTLEHYILKRWPALERTPRVLRTVVTLSFVAVTLPMYLSLLVDSNWIKLNPPPVPAWSNTLSKKFVFPLLKITL